ncbi:hypothetical protein [Crocinitomix catalasitica]|uniref:hypothetical protein n=1 Tax=Crocinitomix catalasitica TaxID=184607 RepID=UPI0004880ADE|nr:hypothetical protein [Crocinitomix catalasitica]
MKNLIIILGFILLLLGCSKKDAIVPKEYQGNWIGEEKVLVFTYKHYLNINDHGSGNYKSEGTFGKDYSGTVTLNGSELKISRHTFNVD